MATHSSTLAWKIPWAEEPARLQSMGSLRVGHDWTTSLSLFTFMHWRRKWQPTPVFLPGESQGLVKPGGQLSMGSHRVGHDWSNLAAAAAADDGKLGDEQSWIVSEVKLLNRVWYFEIPWTIAYQAPLSMEFSRQEYWSGLPFPSPGDLPDPGIETSLPHCRQMFYPLSHQGSSMFLIFWCWMVKMKNDFYSHREQSGSPWKGYFLIHPLRIVDFFPFCSLWPLPFPSDELFFFFLIFFGF